MATPKKKTQVEYLPAATVTAIDNLSLKGFHRANAIQMVASIIRLCERESDTLEDYKTISAAYFTKISANYSPALAALKAANIVQVYTSEKGTQYSTAAGVAKAYRVNPDLLDKADAAAEFTVKADKVRCQGLSPEMEEWVTEDLLGLRIDVQAAREDVEFELEYLTSKRWQVLPTSPEYRQNGYSNDVRFGTSPTKYRYRIRTIIDEVLTKPENAHLGLYRRGEGYVICTDKQFLVRKKNALSRARYRSINAIEKRQFFARQVDSNNRVHHTITEFSKELLGHVTYQGEELCEVDVRNSQMAVLAHVMEHGDVISEGFNFPELTRSAGSRAFLHACQVGTIYDELAPRLGLLRSQAKDEAFRTFFGGVNKGSLTWKTVAQHYGQVAAWTETVKSWVVGHDEKGNSIKFNLALYLQRVEAWIMMEHVYPALKKAGIVALSKHDSFLIPENQVAAAETIVESVFTDLGYKATLKNKIRPHIMQTLTPTVTVPPAENWLVQAAGGTVTSQSIAQRFEAQRAAVI